MPSKKDDPLKGKIEKAIFELLSPLAGNLTAEQKLAEQERRNNLREAVGLAIKWQAVKNKANDKEWGSGFGKETNGDGAADEE